MKRKITALSFIVLFVSAFLLQGCSTANIIAVAGKTYTYTVEPESGFDLDRFKATSKNLCRTDAPKIYVRFSDGKPQAYWRISRFDGCKIWREDLVQLGGMGF